MDTSASLEQPIIDRFTAEYDIAVTGQQVVVWIEVLPEALGMPGVWIRGSIDGIGTDSEGKVGLVEVKAFGPSYLEKWRKQGMKGFPEYDAQFQLYIEGLRRKGIEIDGGWFVVGEKGPDGELLNVTFDWIPRRYATFVGLKRKVQQVEALAAQGADPDHLDCDRAYGCPYWKLHDGDPEMVDLLAASWLWKREMLTRERDRLTKQLDELKEQIERQVLKGQPGSVVVTDGREHSWTVTNYTQERVSWNRKGLEEFLGDDLTKYQTKKTSTTTRITKKTDKGEGEK